MSEDGAANEMVKNDAEMEVEEDEMERRRPEPEEFATWVKYKSFVGMFHYSLHTALVRYACLCLLP